MKTCFFCDWAKLPVLVGPHSNAVMEKTPQIAANVKDKRRRILADLEHAIEGRENADFAAICDRDKTFYGKEGTPKRRKFGKTAWNIKNLKFEDYLHQLKKYNVEPSARTKALVAETKPPADESEDESPTIVKPPKVVSILPPPPEVKTPEPMSTGEAKTPVRGTPTRSASKPPSSASVSGTPVRSILSMEGLTLESSDSVPEHTALAIMTKCGILGLGTKEHPHVVAVNTDYPERNQLFDIERITSIINDRWTYEGFHIRCVTFEPDKEWFEAEICTTYPHTINRSVLICAPSRTFLFGLLTGYHNVLDCPNTHTAHNITKTALEDKTKHRNLEWYLLVFPPDVVLDNAIFSPNATHVEMNEIALRAVRNPTIGLEQNLDFTTVYWRIGIMGSGRKAGGPTARDVRRVEA